MRYHESSDCFEYPQKAFLNQATRKKKILAKLKISHPKTPLVIPVT